MPKKQRPGQAGSVGPSSGGSRSDLYLGCSFPQMGLRSGGGGVKRVVDVSTRSQ
jgi:hypothetical protein